MRKNAKRKDNEFHVVIKKDYWDYSYMIIMLIFTGLIAYGHYFKYLRRLAKVTQSIETILILIQIQ